MEPFWIALSAGIAGFIHSLIPSHWLFITVIGKSRKWRLREIAMASLVGSIGHLVTSTVIGILVLALGQTVLENLLEWLEEHGAWFLVAIGLLYAGLSFFRHQSCEHHSHHHDEPSRKTSNPWWVILAAGFTPCAAILPLFALAAPFGSVAMAGSIVVYGLSVFLALFIASATGILTTRSLHWSFLEHRADLIAGVILAIVGLSLVLFHPHHS